MNSNRTRLVALLAVVVVAAGMFLVLKPSDETNDDSTSGTDTEKVTSTPERPVEANTEKPKPEIPEVSFENGEPVGGVLTVEAAKGDTVAFKVRSDVSEEIHVHGYDVSRAVGPGKPVTLSFPADLVGIYEIEMEGAGIPIAELEITP